MAKELKRRSQTLRFNYLSQSNRDYLVENLTMLLASGMDVLSTLEALKLDIKTYTLKRNINFIEEMINDGSPLWKALDAAKIFPAQTVALIRVGEKTGRLVENLQVVSVQQEKDREFKSKIRSAMMYPIFVLGVTLVVGLGISWFILPRLATVFNSLDIALPLVTVLLINFGLFLSTNGFWFMPLLFAALFFFAYFIFFFKYTKIIGQWLVFRLPIVGKLVKEVELARFGFIFGNLLDAGLPITEALASLKEIPGFYQYKKFYNYLADSIGEGNSLAASFKNYKHTRKLISIPIQQIVVAGERSGRLSESLIKIGRTYESRIDTSTKNLSVILEPALLFIVALAVLGVAIAVVLPIYSLVGGFNY